MFELRILEEKTVREEGTKADSHRDIGLATTHETDRAALSLLRRTLVEMNEGQSCEQVVICHQNFHRKN